MRLQPLSAGGSRLAVRIDRDIGRFGFGAQGYTNARG